MKENKKIKDNFKRIKRRPVRKKLTRKLKNKTPEKNLKLNKSKR
jgi:hypothetical protein